MSRVKSKSLFDLIHSLSPNEKRHFKINHTGNGDPDDKKMLLLFDYLNKQKVFNEERVSEVIPAIKSSQLSNLKAYLYEKVMLSLRQYNLPKILDLQIREQIDFAQLLFERRLYQQGKTCLKKANTIFSACNWRQAECSSLLMTCWPFPVLIQPTTNLKKPTLTLL